MDIFVRNVPAQSTSDQLKDFLRTNLLQLDILAFEINKFRYKNFAILSLPDVDKANQFLSQHGVSWPSTKPNRPLDFRGVVLNCSPSNKPPNEYLIKSLRHAEQLAREKQNHHSRSTGLYPKSRLKTLFTLQTLYCGTWFYNEKEELTFLRHYMDRRVGTITIGTSSLVILLHCTLDPTQCRIDIPYYSIEHVLTGKSNDPTITLTLKWAPKIYEDFLTGDMYNPNTSKTEALTNSMTRLSMQNQGPQRKRVRLSAIDKEHADIVGSCYVYRIVLSDGPQLKQAVATIKRRAGIPNHHEMATKALAPDPTFKKDYDRLKGILENYTSYALLTYTVRFQITRLVLGGILPPSTFGKELLQHLCNLVTEYTANSVATALRRFASLVDFPGPTADLAGFRRAEISKLLRQLSEIAHTERDESVYKLVEDNSHLALVHKVMITPCAKLLAGPEPEVTNRVLRKYANYHEYFLRVTFGDEDCTPIHFDARATQERIYHDRFKHFLEYGIKIAGRVYQFLGFSHSSLRSQSCWFMAPFMKDGTLIYSQVVIKGLGDFTTFRSPAKCAARIGQTFSDTMTSVTIHNDAWIKIKDIERNGRVFSDGCGTISKTLLQQVWLQYGVGRALKPTTIQIRFAVAGVKGVVSLDSGLEGDKICTRPSMKKFDEANSTDIELCGGSFKPLPLYLNRQFIKILEDLQVPSEVFLQLQSEVVRKLRAVTLNTLNASIFLTWRDPGQAAKTAGLLFNMNTIGLSFQQDKFLKDLIEIAVLSKLREIKYRSRIPIEEGHTLYGIMDETGFLKEGQVYLCTENMVDGRRRLKVIQRKQVVITRAPALHPGDVQIVEAIDVPSSSPLKHLYNCVVFSQHGARDLPSQLSGGDLDGDLFQVIYDARLIPQSTVTPADYPRQNPVDIGRPVEIKDMTDFFIQFMETDQLGRISTLHQIWADRRPNGTFDPECINLAEMASTAVDFSKTGIPVDLSKLPRSDNLRPDFMATSPRVFVEAKGAVLEEIEDDDEIDPVSALDPDQRRYRYYESDRVLGRLYRAIDEAEFFSQMRRDSRNMGALNPRNSLMENLLDYVKREATAVQYTHYKDLAMRLRTDYESKLLETMAQYSTHPGEPLTELEVFSGIILGKSLGVQNKQTRTNAKDMGERFNRDVSSVIRRIVGGEDEDGYEVGREEALPRALACFQHAISEKGPYWPRKNLVSWRYITAAQCLEELKRFQGGKLREFQKLLPRYALGHGKLGHSRNQWGS